MRRNKKIDIGPEVRLRRALHRRGLRFRKNHAVALGGLRLTADIVFPRQRLIVLVDGCFWHSCPADGNAPRPNEAYWLPKLAKNQQRDLSVYAAARAAGWRVRRVWEHED